MLKKFLQLAKQARAFVILFVSTVILCGLSNNAQAIAFSSISQLYFFGDSLTDSGYNDLWSFPTPLPAGKAPTFTTFGGYTYAQYMARDIKGAVLPIYPVVTAVTVPNPPDTLTNNSEFPVPGFVSGTLKGTNYAAAGSTTNSTGFNETWAPSLLQQVGFYEANNGQRADPNAVYVILSGANDILTTLTSGAPTELQLLLTAQTAAQNIANAAASLSAAGAKRIVVLALPNLGVTPLITGLALSEGIPTLPAEIKTVTFAFNSFLNTALGKVIQQYGTSILYEDIYDLLDNIILATAAGQPYVVAGQAFTFANVTTPACSTVSSAIYCPSTAPTNFLFADVLHPSGMAHRVLSLQVETDIANW
jgi:outer membrane lipase/esterase